VVSKTYVETSTELLEGLDEMVREGYYANRTEGINDAIRLLLKQYKLSKLHAKDSSLMGSIPFGDGSAAAPGNGSSSRKPAAAGGETGGK
jgi:Arc/MetJ-type ribon-helix-helix transcriptional regulator